MKMLFEFDFSNNKFSGIFFYVVLEIFNLVYFDICFNYFYGKLLREFFLKYFDVFFVNNCNFEGELLDIFGYVKILVMVFVNNNFYGKIFKDIGCLNEMLEEIVVLNNNFYGSFLGEIGVLRMVYFFDYSDNCIIGGFLFNI